MLWVGLDGMADFWAISRWKAMIRERLRELFSGGTHGVIDSERRVADLHRKPGELTVDLEYLKKSRYHSERYRNFCRVTTNPVVIGMDTLQGSRRGRRRQRWLS